MQLTSSQKKPLRRIAHHLDPVVLIGDQGLSEGVIEETQRALSDHELIKVRIDTADRTARGTMGDDLATACNAQIVQRIGKITVLFRANPKPNVKLSNLHRFSGSS